MSNIKRDDEPTCCKFHVLQHRIDLLKAENEQLKAAARMTGEACAASRDVIGRAKEQVAFVEKLLASAIARQPSTGDWRQIDTAPKDGTTIILRAGNLVDTAHWQDNWERPHVWAGWLWHTITLQWRTAMPTHWMPLPKPPKDAA